MPARQDVDPRLGSAMISKTDSTPLIHREETICLSRYIKRPWIVRRRSAPTEQWEGCEASLRHLLDGIQPVSRSRTRSYQAGCQVHTSSPSLPRNTGAAATSSEESCRRALANGTEAARRGSFSSHTLDINLRSSRGRRGRWECAKGRAAGPPNAHGGRPVTILDFGLANALR